MQRLAKQDRLSLAALLTALLGAAVFGTYFFMTADDAHLQRVIGLSLLAVLTVLFLLTLLIVVRIHSRQNRAIRLALAEAHAAENEKEQELRVNMALADIYYSMHIIDLTNFSFTEYASRNEVHSVIGADKTNNAAVVLSKVLRTTMSDESLEAALRFADVSSLAERMKGRRIIFEDFLGRNVGWIRLSFITCRADADGVPQEVIVATQIVDAEKRREAQLIRASSTDKLTGMLNRKAYEEDMAAIGGVPHEDDFVIIVNDVNGMKTANDTYGHEAGDELLLGASQCMARCIGNYGRVYRTGGDEFIAIIYADEKQLAAIKADFEDAVNHWSGTLVHELAISTGYASKREFPGWTARDLAAMADRRMYEDKAAYYQNTGRDRRGQHTAYSALNALYTKILRVDLNRDVYQIITMDPAEQQVDMGFSNIFSEWLTGFGRMGFVHPDDLDAYLAQVNLDVIRAYFRADKQSMALAYRRRFGDGFKLVAMEMIPTEHYTDEEQSVYLFVKRIDK